MGKILVILFLIFGMCVNVNSAEITYDTKVVFITPTSNYLCFGNMARSHLSTDYIKNGFILKNAKCIERAQPLYPNKEFVKTHKIAKFQSITYKILDTIEAQNRDCAYSFTTYTASLPWPYSITLVCD